MTIVTALPIYSRSKSAGWQLSVLLNVIESNAESNHKYFMLLRSRKPDYVAKVFETGAFDLLESFAGEVGSVKLNLSRGSGAPVIGAALAAS